MAGGRPSKYEERFCEMLIEHMSIGHTFESFAGKIDVCRDTIFRWAKEIPEFSDAKKRAREKQLVANEKLFLDLATGRNRKGNVTAAIFLMKNCHKWTDKVEHEHSGEIGINIDHNDSNL